MELRRIRNDELDQAIALADAVFRGPAHTSMRDAFPAIFAKGKPHSLGAFSDEGVLASFIGLVPSVIRVGRARIKAFSIGAVCTHTDFRGQGLAGKLLELSKRHAEASGASLLFISGDRSLYTRVHCYPFGRAIRFVLNREAADRLLASPTEYTLRPAEHTDWHRLQDIAAARPVAFEQSVDELPRLVEAAAMASCYLLEHQTLVAADANGLPAAYAVVAVPGEHEPTKAPVAVEWGGPADAVALLLAEAVRRSGIAQLDVPVVWADPLQTALQGHGLAGESEPNAGTVYVVNAQRLLEQTAPYRADAGIAEPTLAAREDGSYELTWDGAVRVLTPGELVSALLDPEAPELASGTGSPAVPLPFLNGLNYI